MKQTKIVRAVLIEYNGWLLTVKTDSDNLLIIPCNKDQIRELDELKPFLHPGITLNLVNLASLEDSYSIEFVILEPDYLIDISSLAECFKPYGDHPLNYTLLRLKNREITAPILLGNTANFFMDECIYAEDIASIEYVASLKKLFRLSAFEFSVCKDLKEVSKEADFFRNCRKHFSHIRQIVTEVFTRTGIQQEKIILEPAFISNALGLQGRMDLLLSDYSALIELKSGKAFEDFRTGGSFIRSALNHYIQMILYSAVLEFNRSIQPEHTACYLLYSKYPVLSQEKQNREALKQALHLRNRIVALEYSVQSANNIGITQNILEQVCSSVLNKEKLTGHFFDHYLAPSIDSFQKSYAKLNAQEKTYFLRLYTFIVKELWLSKVGEKEYEGIKKPSVLWNASFEDQLTAGEILYDLSILDNKAAEEEHSITLAIPCYPNSYSPNFREGDAIVLYERNSLKDKVNNHQVFKGSIERLMPGQITVRLRYRQKNREVWHSGSFYAIEHDYMDTTYTSLFRALHTFLNANQDRKDLLLCQRFPNVDDPECFLLVGPPGTGKTSVFLKNTVEEVLKKRQGDLLLLAYTNRAVDEICKALSSISGGVDYIRIGNELNCAPEYRNKLLENQVADYTTRKEVTTVITNCRIFVGTVAAIWNKPELLQLKSFDLCMVDEATQLLEPHLLGVLCAQTDNKSNSIKRFILIGDHKQLPAIVLQSKAESNVNEELLNEIGLDNLRNSLFERLYKKYEREGYTHWVGLLSKQGRMHPDIASFPSEFFYDGLLTCVGLPHQTEVWNDEKRLHFYSVKANPKEGSAKINIREANEVVRICKRLYHKHKENNLPFSAESIGIITPFRNQIAQIKKQLQETRIPELSGMTVDTVERFQGSQKDIIIYSFCIKSVAQLEALPNWLEENNRMIDRKLNVVLTRAKKQLFIIGDEELLSQNPLYKELIQHIREKGEVQALSCPKIS